MSSLDIDTYLNRIVPRPRFDVLPRFISHFFGYRPPKSSSDPEESVSPQHSTLLRWLFSFIGAFIGIAIIEKVYQALPKLGGNTVPTILASFGAAAILQYNSFDSPLAQPRNLIFGHLLSTVIGVGITKLFQHLSPSRFNELRWLAGALSVATASTAMNMTNTVYPPAGATTLLIATMSEFTALGWWMLPLVLLASALMLASAMLVNNLYACFPKYWWTPEDLSQSKKNNDANDVEKGDAEKGDNDSASNIEPANRQHEQTAWRSESVSDADTVTNGHLAQTDSRPSDKRILRDAPVSTIQISPNGFVLPEGMEVNEGERELLVILQERLRQKASGNA